MNAYADYSGRGVNLPSAAVMTYCAPQHGDAWHGCALHLQECRYFITLFRILRSLIMDLVQPANLSKPEW